SICDNAVRASNSAIATPSVGANATAPSNTFDGRCVNTIVRRIPNRRANRGAIKNDAVCNTPTAKNTNATVATDAPNLVANQYARNAWITKPPPNESSANSAESRVTAGRDTASFVAVRRLPSRPTGSSTFADSERAIAAPAT